MKEKDESSVCILCYIADKKLDKIVIKQKKTTIELWWDRFERADENWKGSYWIAKWTQLAKGTKNTTEKERK